jgi:hypothetical protein
MEHARPAIIVEERLKVEVDVSKYRSVVTGVRSVERIWPGMQARHAEVDANVCRYIRLRVRWRGGGEIGMSHQKAM